MIKNKNGFTLIEILVTIGILAVLTTIIGVSVSQLIDNANDKKMKEFTDEIEKAACAYIDYQGINESLCADDVYPDLCEVTYEELLHGKDSNLNDVEDLKVKDSDENSGFIKSSLFNPEKNQTVEEIINEKDENRKIVAATVKFKDGEKICTYANLNNEGE